MKMSGHPESSDQQQAVELDVEELVSDTSKQVSLVEVKIFGLKRYKVILEMLCKDIFIGRAECQLDIVIFTRCSSA